MYKKSNKNKNARRFSCVRWFLFFLQLFSPSNPIKSWDVKLPSIWTVLLTSLICQFDMSAPPKPRIRKKSNESCDTINLWTFSFGYEIIKKFDDLSFWVVYRFKCSIWTNSNSIFFEWIYEQKLWNESVCFIEISTSNLIFS